MKLTILWMWACCLLLMFCQCSNNASNSQISKASPAELAGAKVYSKYCVACHGQDGKLGMSGASNLTVSMLTNDEAKQVVTNGRRLMAPFKDRLKPEEIDEVITYIMTLRR